MVSMSLRILESPPRELPPKADVFLEKRSLIRLLFNIGKAYDNKYSDLYEFFRVKGIS